MILPTNPNIEERVTCRIRKRWLGDHAYVDIISPSGRVARVYKYAWKELDIEKRQPIADLLVTIIVTVEGRNNISEIIGDIPSYLDYDLDISVTDMTRIADWPITELFESVEEADKQITTNIRVA